MELWAEFGRFHAGLNEDDPKELRSRVRFTGVSVNTKVSLTRREQVWKQHHSPLVRFVGGVKQWEAHC